MPNLQIDSCVSFIAIPTLALFWLGVDFGVGDIDAQDLVVKVVLLVLFFSILRRIYLDFFRSGR